MNSPGDKTFAELMAQVFDHPEIFPDGTDDIEFQRRWKALTDEHEKRIAELESQLAQARKDGYSDGLHDCLQIVEKDMLISSSQQKHHILAQCSAAIRALQAEPPAQPTKGVNDEPS